MKKTNIKFYDHKTKNISNCSDPLHIEISNIDLNWDGIILEKGWSPHFYPNNVSVSDFYFALALEAELNWEAMQDGAMSHLKTQPGDIWMTPPDTPFTHNIDEPCYFIILTISEEILWNHFQEKKVEDQVQFLKEYNVSDDYLKNLIELFYFETYNKGKSGYFFLNNLLYLFSTYYIKNYSNYLDLFSKRSKSNKINENTIKNIKDFIINNIANELTIEKIALEMNMSKFYFLKEFKKQTGITPYQYILKIKMEKASELLINTNQSLAEIAYSLGFNDQSHFSNTFKRFFNKSPKEYRN